MISAGTVAGGVSQRGNCNVMSDLRSKAAEVRSRLFDSQPFDPRVLLRGAMAVAKAAIDSGVSQEPLDLNVYEDQVSSRIRKWVNGEPARV